MKLVMFLLPFLTITMAAARVTPSQANNFIAGTCKKTVYPTVCIQTLNPYAETIHGDPILLTHTAVHVVAYNIDGMKNCTGVLYNKARKLNATTVLCAALKDCKENLADARGEVRDSLDQMKAMNSSDLHLPFHKSNVLTWLSAAMTNAETCVEGVTEAAEKMAAMRFKNDVLECKNNFLVQERTSISLYFVNSYY